MCVCARAQINFLHGTTLPHRTLDQGGLGCCSWASSKLISSPAILNGPESVRSGCNGVRKNTERLEGEKNKSTKASANWWLTSLCSYGLCTKSRLFENKQGFERRQCRRQKKKQDLPPLYISLISQRRKTTAGITGKERGKKKKIRTATSETTSGVTDR